MNLGVLVSSSGVGVDGTGLGVSISSSWVGVEHAVIKEAEEGVERGEWKRDEHCSDLRVEWALTKELDESGELM